jgi:hypothetical protein
VTLRRRTALSTTLQPDKRAEYARFSRGVRERDGRCIGPAAGFPGECGGSESADHIRASHGISIKSISASWNGAWLCSVHHDWKTRHGKKARALLIDFLHRRYGYEVAA